MYIKGGWPIFPKQIPRGEVVRMWKKRILAVLRVLVCLAVGLMLMTTKAC